MKHKYRRILKLTKQFVFLFVAHKVVSFFTNMFCLSHCFYFCIVILCGVFELCRVYFQIKLADIVFNAGKIYYSPLVVTVLTKTMCSGKKSCIIRKLLRRN